VVGSHLAVDKTFTGTYQYMNKNVKVFYVIAVVDTYYEKCKTI